MKRKAFERCLPETVGIDSQAIEAFLDALENGGFTQMHGLMIMRHGKVCAEGWWKPFNAELHHCCHSLSKTYTATAIGIAEYEGLLSLGDRVCDIFPEVVLPDSPKRLLQLTVRDLLVMGAGMEEEPFGYPKDWRVRFLNQAYQHEPGTFWPRVSLSCGCEVRKCLHQSPSGVPRAARLHRQLLHPHWSPSQLSSTHCTPGSYTQPGLSNGF